MYILNREEEGRLKLWARDARYEYFKKNKYIFVEEALDDNLEKDSNFSDDEIHLEKFEEIFTEEKMYKIAKAMTEKDKSVLSLYYIYGKTDEEISKVIHSTRKAISMRRERALKKIRKKYKGEK